MLECVHCQARHIPEDALKRFVREYFIANGIIDGECYEQLCQENQEYLFDASEVRWQPATEAVAIWPT